MKVITETKKGVIVGSRLAIADNETYEDVLAECERYLIKTYNFRDRVRFIIGDVLNAMHNRYKHGDWEQLIPDVSALYNGEQGVATLVNWASVCDRVPLAIRNDLSFTHHANVAYVTKADCHKFLRDDSDYLLYCRLHNKNGLHTSTLQEFLLNIIGRKMTARELHNYRMAIIGKRPIDEPIIENTLGDEIGGYFSVLKDMRSICRDSSLSVENRLLKIDAILDEILENEGELETA